ncbi:MAG TPA: MFS transporter [Micromonosporaceae bacterium]|jgi:EmrB/QacA subfamily drug resistance transporter
MTRSSWVLTLTSASAFMVALDQLVVATALATMQRDLHASLATLEWTVNAYSLGFAVLLMTGSALGDRFGRRRVLMSGVALFTVSSALCALAPTVGALIAARTVQGAASALVLPNAMAIVTAAFPPAQRGRALGIFTALMGTAVVAGPILGGAITQGLDWPWIFWLNVPIGLLVLPMLRLRTDETRGPARRIDVVGVLLAAGAALGLVWALIRGNGAGWGSAEVLATLAGGALLLVAFVAWERRVSDPMLPLHLFRSRGFAIGNASAFFLYATLASSVFFLAQFLQLALGFDPLAAGLRMAPWTATVLICAPLSGRFVDRFGPRIPLVFGLLAQAAGFTWIAAISDSSRGYPTYAIALALAGCGITAAMPAAQAAVLGAVEPAAIGKASGTLNTMRQVGAAFGVAILAAVFATHGSYASAASFRLGVTPAIAVAAGMSVVGALIGVALPRRRSSSGVVPSTPTRERAHASA